MVCANASRMDDRSRDQLLRLLKEVDEIGPPIRRHYTLERIFRLLEERPDAAWELYSEANGAFHHANCSGVLDNKDVANMTALIQCLEDAGANVNLRNKKGRRCHASSLLRHVLLSETF